jgi:hypothetical protein
MQQANTHVLGAMLPPKGTPNSARGRLLAGLLQGLLLYGFSVAVKEHLWLATQPYLFAPLLLVCLFIPVLLTLSLGHLKAAQIVRWLTAAALIVAALAVHDVWRHGGSSLTGKVALGELLVASSTGVLIPCIVIGLYIGHILVLAGAQQGRLAASYPACFDLAWKHLIQLLLSVCFIIVLRLLVWLGGALFMMARVDFLAELLQASWFVIPLMTFSFAWAIHLTDARPAMVLGIRTLILGLLSLMLPLLVLIVAGFLLSLAWTGLNVLWAEPYASVLLLAMAAVLILLVNAAFQDGQVASQVPGVVRLSARVAALLLPALVALAMDALAQRVGDRGWTVDYILVAYLLLVTGAYALGYAWSATRRTGWLDGVARVNVAVAFLILATLPALFSPVADPARLMVQAQAARLVAGKVDARHFNFDSFRCDGARYGTAALERMKAQVNGTQASLIRENAQAALQRKLPEHCGAEQPDKVDVAANLRVWPVTEKLPASFLAENWMAAHMWPKPLCLTLANKQCDAYLIDLNGDGKHEVLLIGAGQNSGAVVLGEDENGRWQLAATVPQALAGCASIRQQLIAGNYRSQPGRWQDLQVAGQRIALQPAEDAGSLECAAAPPVK